MSLPKKENGIGFKDLQEFNKALLAKQAWRILHNPSSLIARLYKGLYFPNTNYLKASKENYASYWCKSLEVGKSLLQLGLRVRICNGQTTKIWEDLWLPNLPPRPAYGPALDPNMTVSDLWLDSKRECDPLIFEGVLSLDENQLLAKELYLSQHAGADTYEWAYNQTTQYTVRSGYWLATHIAMDKDEEIRPPNGSIRLKQEIWRLKIAPKLQHFLWWCLSRAVPTATQLRSHTISANPTCQRCCLDDESINHILFTCPYAQAIWRCVVAITGRQMVFG